MIVRTKCKYCNNAYVTVGNKCHYCNRTCAVSDNKRNKLLELIEKNRIKPLLMLPAPPTPKSCMPSHGWFLN